HRHRELDRLFAEPGDHLALLARGGRAFQGVVHLQQRNDALTKTKAHPKFGVPRPQALNQRVKRLARFCATELLATPRMLWIGDAAPCLFKRELRGPSRAER